MTKVIGYQLYFDRRKYYNYTISVRWCDSIGGEKMKSIVKKLVKDEKGAALALALILLLIGGLISAALLNHMGSGILAGEVHERRTAELYAADAGVEDAIWKITHNYSISYPYHYPDPLIMNGKSVDIVIYREDLDPTCGEDFRYRIISTAASADGGNTAAIVSATTVEAYVSALSMNFTALLDHAIVSYDTIGLKPGDVVIGDVWLPNEDDLSIQPSSAEPEAVINGEVKDSDDMVITWPTYDQLSSYYWEDVEHLETEAYPDGYVIDITGTTETDPYIIGPLLAAGDLTIKGDGWIKLDGTIYVEGTLFTNPTPEIHITLEGHTIFAEDDIILNPGVWLHGSGCIIARYDIDFQPNLDTEDENFVLVLSLEGEVQFNPGTSFTGCIAGNAHVQLQPGNTINWVDPEGKGLDFPGVEGGGEPPPVDVVNIETWEIIQQ